jgi:hypothetical protein
MRRPDIAQIEERTFPGMDSLSYIIGKTLYSLDATLWKMLFRQCQDLRLNLGMPSEDSAVAGSHIGAALWAKRNRR